MASDNSQKIQELKAKLENLTKIMDVPCFRYSSVKWLSKNLQIRNKNHPNIDEALLILRELNKLGVS